VPVVSGTFFSREACEHLQATGQLPKDAVINLVEFPEPRAITAPDNVVQLRDDQLRDEALQPLIPRLEALVGRLNAMNDPDLLTFMKQLVADES